MFGRSQDTKKSSTDKGAAKRVDNKDNEKREKEKPAEKPILGKDGGLLRMAAEKSIDKKKR